MGLQLYRIQTQYIDKVIEWLNAAGAAKNSPLYEEDANWYLHVEIRNKYDGEVVAKFSDEISSTEWSIEFVE